MSCMTPATTVPLSLLTTKKQNSSRKRGGVATNHPHDCPVRSRARKLPSSGYDRDDGHSVSVAFTKRTTATVIQAVHLARNEPLHRSVTVVVR